MTRKSLGYTELEWVCPNCGQRNPGSRRTCAGCGTPQPDNVEFVQPLQEELIDDEAAIAAAQAGPDIHCAFCGARNPATAKVCRQCGADLTEGEARQKGKVVGAFGGEPAPPIVCPSCGAENPATATTCSACGARLPGGQAEKPESKPGQKSKPARRIPILAIFAIFIGLCVGLFFLLNRTSDTIAEVSDLKWSRSIAVQQLVPVTREAWKSEIPADVEIGLCRSKLHHTQEDPAPNSKEVCGTPYTVDTGTGYGEVVQDCKYEVYREWCEYTRPEWQVVDTLVAEGSDGAPDWPVLSLKEGQREGGREETYVIIFRSDNDTYRMSTSRQEEWRKFRIGTRWKLKVNALGGVTDAEPLE